MQNLDLGSIIRWGMISLVCKSAFTGVGVCTITGKPNVPHFKVFLSSEPKGIDDLLLS